MPGGDRRRGKPAGGERLGWSRERRVAEDALRESLRLSGIEPPRQCPACGASLEAVRGAGGLLTLVCAGPCGKQDGRSALAHLRSAGAPVLPGFDGR
jgi:hypothetical protein